MTTTPVPVRHFNIPPEALIELCQGYLQLISHLQQGWAVGLIFADGARPADELLADKYERNGIPMLWLRDFQLHQMASGDPTPLSDDDGGRYLITVDDVEQLDDLLEELDDEDDED